ncbi:hypothetical protein GOODEAATRI_000061, partial [Goodea atripinnis]
DCESASRELGKLKERHLEQAVKYSRALEEQGKATTRERELMRQALMDILQQDRREAAEQRQELCEIVTRLQGELRSAEENRDKVKNKSHMQCIQKTAAEGEDSPAGLEDGTEEESVLLQPNHGTGKGERPGVKTCFLAVLLKQCSSCSVFKVNLFPFMVGLFRDSLQLEYTDCLLDKNRLRKRIAELQANLEQQQRELERERDRCREQMEQSPCLNCGNTLNLLCGIPGPLCTPISFPRIWSTCPQFLLTRPPLMFPAYSKLCSERSSTSFVGADSFYARVNLNMEPHGDPPSLGVSCDDIVHVTDTRHNGKYQWRCSLVDRDTAVPLQTGIVPNYNRLDRYS